MKSKNIISDPGDEVSHLYQSQDDNGGSVKIFPWEQGVPPTFSNEKGFDWYLDDSLTNWSNDDRPLNESMEPLNATCFMVAKDGNFDSFVLISNITNDIIAAEGGISQMGAKIDVLRLIKLDKAQTQGLCYE